MTLAPGVRSLGPDAVHRIIGVVAACLAGALLLISGIILPARGGFFLMDFPYFYAAGRSWVEGGSMYDGHLYREKFGEVTDVESLYDGLVYPPTFAPYVTLISLPDYRTARILHTGMNFLAIGLLIFVVARTVDHPLERGIVPKPSYSHWYLAAVLLGNPFTIRALRLGQTTLWSAVFLLGGWYLARRNREVLGGILLGLACFKPQWVILPGIWLLVEGRWRVLLASAVTALCLASYAFVKLGPVHALTSWWSVLAAATGAQTGPDAVGKFYNVGLPNLLTAVGVRVPGTMSLLAGVAVPAVVLLRFWNRVPRDYVLGVLVLLQASLIYAHSYDLVYLASLAPVFWPSRRAGRGTIAALLTVLLVLSLPNQAIPGAASMPLLLHRRTVIVVGILWIVAVKMLRARERTEDARGG